MSIGSKIFVLILGYQGHQPYDDDDKAEEDDEVEDNVNGDNNNKDNNHDKGILAL